MKPEFVKQQVDRWLTSVVIGLNLCPFAQHEYRQNTIRFSVSAATLEDDVVSDLIAELTTLNEHDDIETSLLILPKALSDFFDFNDFLGLADQIIEKMGLDGVFQVASFHPDYQFAGTQTDDPENYTNRSPYPILHLLREASLEYAIERHPNVDKIPEDNIELMSTLGNKYMASLLQKCVRLDD